MIHSKKISIFIFFTTTITLLLFVLGGLWTPKKRFLELFKQLPVQHEGRIKPMDTVARVFLLEAYQKQALKNPAQEASAFLMDLLLDTQKADKIPCFYINHPELLSLLGKENTHTFSYNQLKPFFENLYSLQQNIAQKENQSTFEKSVNKLCNNLSTYNALLHSLHPIGLEEHLVAEYYTWLSLIPAGMNAIQQKARNETFDAHAFENFIAFADRYKELSDIANIGIIPRQDGVWDNIGMAYLQCIPSNPSPVLLHYLELAQNYQEKDLKKIEESLINILQNIQGYYDKTKIKTEFIFNTISPFYKASVLYVLAFIFLLAFWLLGNKKIYNISMYVLVFAFLIHTGGLILRIYIQGRPPVTNLYSSAVFVGWAGVVLSLVFERIYKNGLGALVVCILGSTTLIIAHHLSLSGDTLEMMRAVLNSNFWLSTHVICVSLGYASMFLAGTFGLVYVLSIWMHKVPPKPHIKSLASMAYASVCFATLFSFVGTMLGGIWADMSWGRFWGWDPKENGALLIILWCAITLHAKWSKIVQEKGFMLCNIFGNIVTAWSWFGTNMLGVGLHSYGFIDKAFMGLSLFILTQLVFILLGVIYKKTPTAV